MGTRLPDAEITGVFGALLKKAVRRKVGKVPDSVGAMWHSPAVFRSFMGFLNKVEKWRNIDPNLVSFASMATASYIGCSACLDIGYFAMHNRGLDVVKAREVPRWRESDAFTPLERKVMAYAEAMSQTPPAVTDEMSAELLDELGAPALLELTARIGVMNLNARTNITLGIRSEEFAASCGLPPLAARSTGSDVASSA